MQTEAEAALQRALLVFCKQRPEIHLFAARYHERHGRVDQARERYTHVVAELAPRLIQAVVAAANFERRQVSNVMGCICQ
jgi:pre-mRNA-processing factor 39